MLSSNTLGLVFSDAYDNKNRLTNTVDSSGVALNQTFDLLNVSVLLTPSRRAAREMPECGHATIHTRSPTLHSGAEG